MAIWEGDPKRWYVTRVEDAGLEMPRVYGRPWGGWKAGPDRFREGRNPIGVEPDEVVLSPGDCVERFDETFTRCGQPKRAVVCRPATPEGSDGAP